MGWSSLLLSVALTCAVGTVGGDDGDGGEDVGPAEAAGGEVSLHHLSKLALDDDAVFYEARRRDIPRVHYVWSAGRPVREPGVKGRAGQRGRKGRRHWQTTRSSWARDDVPYTGQARSRPQAGDPVAWRRQRLGIVTREASSTMLAPSI